MSEVDSARSGVADVPSGLASPRDVPDGGRGAARDEDTRASDESRAHAPRAAVETDIALGAEAGDLRSINRIPIRLAASLSGRGAALGFTRDLSLQGAFIETREPLPVGSAVPVVIELEPKSQLKIHAEVVRVAAEGMGIRFHALDRAASKKLRRWVVEHTSVMGSRRQVEQLHTLSSVVEPIRDPRRIEGFLSHIRESDAAVMLISGERLARESMRLIGFDAHSVRFQIPTVTALQPGEPIFALLTVAFVSYSFEVQVRAVDGKTLVCSKPATIVFSERRTRDRRPAPAGALIRWPSSIIGADGEHEFPLSDLSDYGLSFIAPAGVVLPLGSKLEGAYLVVEGQRIELERTEVRNLRLVSGANDVRVGVSTAIISLGKQVRNGRRVAHDTPVARFFERFKSLVSVVFHRGRERIVGNQHAASRVTFRTNNLPIVGLLDRTSNDIGRLEAPLVIIVPGFAGRKEQMSYLAGIMIEGFQRHNADLAVLRLDGTNNLGESGRDAKSDRDGMQTLRYTVSGVVEDIRAAVAWGKNNPLVEPTQIIIVSVSMASAGVRRYLALPEASDVTLWISYMGAADVVDAVRNVSGNIDLHAYWRRGEKLGVVSMAGMLCDGDHFWKDIAEHGGGDLEAATTEMGKVHADVVWLRGLYDGFMDPRRVELVAMAPAPASRELVDVESGHLPRTGSEAIAHFLGVTERVWTAVTARPFDRFMPSIGRLEVRSNAEWTRVRPADSIDPRAWWRDYLIDENGPGFDIMEYSPEYRAFMDLTAQRASDNLPSGAHILELGAGTGNVTRRMLERGARVTALDIVPEALGLLTAKCSPFSDRLCTAQVDLEGSPWTAMRRFLEGDIRNLGHLSERIPGFSRKLADELATDDGDELLALLRGFELDVPSYARHRRLSNQAARVLRDLWLMARLVGARDDALSPEKAADLRFFPCDLLSGPRGLELPAESVDAVVLSLVVSYLERPEDVLAEARRVLRPGGTMVVSSLRRDAETSRLYLGIIRRLESMPAAELAAEGDPEVKRSSLIAAARRFVDHGAALFRLEEEGLFRFYEQDDLVRLVSLRGFVDIKVESALGHPPQALVVTCRRP